MTEFYRRERNGILYVNAKEGNSFYVWQARCWVLWRGPMEKLLLCVKREVRAERKKVSEIWAYGTKRYTFLVFDVLASEKADSISLFYQYKLLRDTPEPHFTLSIP